MARCAAMVIAVAVVGVSDAVLGQTVEVLSASFSARGRHVLHWTPLTALPAGLCFYEVQTATAEAHVIQRGSTTYGRP